MRFMCIIICCSFIFVLILNTATLSATNPDIEEMVNEVSQERLTTTLQTLQDFDTRYTYSEGNTLAGNWLYSAFENMGLDVERHEFTYGTHTEENIIGRITGYAHPDEIIIVAGHFDTMSQSPETLAPGADDNASAIASVLESALIFKNYSFERTIEFICFNAEEQGRRGSIAIASEYLAAGKNIVAVINTDMIGYWPTGWDRDLDVAYEPVSEWLADRVIAASNDYVGIPISKHLSAACRDDHVSFTDIGIPGITNMDCWDAHNGGGETTPHYHKTTDTIASLNLPCMTQAVQVNIAAVAELAILGNPVTPTPVPSSTPQATSTPQPTSTPDCGTIGVTVWMPSHEFEPGDACSCQIDVCNTSGSDLVGYPLFVILDVFGSLYFAPGFTEELDSYLDFYPHFSPGVTTVVILDDFLWPENVGSGSGIKWHAAMTDPAFTQVFGEWDSWEFGWTP